MNNFIHHSNKLLLTATVALGFGAWTSQLNRANAVIVVGCPDDTNPIGTGAGCVGSSTPYFTHRSCQLGTGPGNVAYCCQYVHSDYWCTNSAGTSFLVGNKGSLKSAVAGRCDSVDSRNEVCVPETHPEDPEDSGGGIVVGL